jgi:signal transduction histidine kinase
LNTQLKIKLLFLSAFLIIILVFSGLIYFSVSNYSYKDFYNLLKIRAVTAAKVELDVNSGEKADGIVDFRTNFLEKLPNEKDYFFEITPAKTFTEEAKQLKIPITFFNNVLSLGEAEYNLKDQFFKGIKYTSLQGDYIVIVTAENYYDSHHFSYLREVLIIAIVIALIFAFLISLLLSKSIFHPLNLITKRVKDISSENLHLRLETKNKSDELGELINTFNNMLDRIETSFETQNNFISNASHELRTPLTAIIGQADVALSKNRSQEHYEETLKIILEEAEKLDKKTQALLFLAQTGFNGKVQKFEQIRMDQLLWDVQETLKNLNPQSKIHIDLSMLPEDPRKLKVCGNEQLLHLALSNVISNACKYSDNRIVEVSIGAGESYVIIVVKDTGIGIPKEELRYIYDPFFRASNSNAYEGYGIGLPLTRNIIRMHKGDLLVSSIENKGTAVQIKLPMMFQ